MLTMRRDAISAAWPLAIAARTVLAVLIPTGLAQLRVAKSAVFAEDVIVLNVFPTNFVALQRIESSVCLAPIIPFWGATLGARAGAVTRTQPELFTVSTPFFKAAGGELASRLWDLPARDRILPYWQGFWPAG